MRCQPTAVPAAVLMLALLTSGPARAEPTPASAPADKDIVVTGGKVHVRRAQAAGRDFRVELQFFKTRHDGQCWNAVGRDKAGHVYLGNSTHGSNSFVYRLDPRTGQMRCLGDLTSHVRIGGRGGSDNGKIHSPFFEGPDGCMYFLSHYGYVGNVRYGGHLWKYDPKGDRIIDLGVPAPGDTNFCLSEPRGGLTYMFSTPSGIFTRYDMATGRFTAVEETSMNYVRHMPVDAEGNLYVVWDNRIHQFSPKVGRWRTVVEHSDPDPARNFGPMTAFCWTADRRRMYFLSYQTGNLFAYEPGATKVLPLGKVHPEGKDLSLGGLHLDAAGNRLYTMGGSSKKSDKGFYLFDLAEQKPYKLFALDDLIEEELEGKVRAALAYVDFNDYGGVTGDDGTMYVGFHGGGRDQDIDPGGKNFVALVAFRVIEEKE